MLLFTHVNTALKQLTSNKGKAALTMLGIVIGIGAVIFIMTTGEIAKSFLLNQITQFGTNVMEITPAGIISENDDITFTMDDIAKIEQSAVLPELTQITGLYPIIKTLAHNGTDHNVTYTALRLKCFPSIILPPAPAAYFLSKTFVIKPE